MWTTPDDGPSEKENHLDDRTWIPLTRASFYSIFTSPSWLSVYEALHGWREDSLQLKWHLIKKRVKITFIHFWWRSKWPANFSTNSGGTVFGWGGQWALSLVGVTKSQDNLYSFQMHGYDYGGRPPLPPPPPPNDLVSPPGYPPIQPSGEQPPFPSVHHSPSMDGYTLTSLDTSNESWGHYKPQSLLWYIHV